jgi:hypothetical protein
MPSLTRLTFPTAVVERNNDAVAPVDSRDRGSDLFDDPAVLVPQNEGRGKRDSEPGPAALPHIVIAAADAIRLDANDGFVRCAIWIRPIAVNDKRLRDLLNNSGFHGDVLSVET